ncbi:MAG: GIY-YIG nuclease family protein [Pseudomonadota bacterium]
MARFDFFAAYILANKKNGTIYTGSTADLVARLEQHKSGAGSVFTGKYDVCRLVWFERFEKMDEAIRRERNIKTWPRKWKIELIEGINPEWEELPLF